MQILIWGVLIVSVSIITTALSANGVFLGAIPTILIYCGMFWLGKTLCKMWKDSRSNEAAPVAAEKDTGKENASVSAEIRNGEKICPKCGTAQKADRTVCWYCGQRFDN